MAKYELHLQVLLLFLFSSPSNSQKMGQFLQVRATPILQKIHSPHRDQIYLVHPEKKRNENTCINNYNYNFFEVKLINRPIKSLPRLI